MNTHCLGLLPLVSLKPTHILVGLQSPRQLLNAINKTPFISQFKQNWVNKCEQSSDAQVPANNIKDSEQAAQSSV